MLLSRNLRQASTEDEAARAARAHTLTIFRQLDGEGRGQIVRFLYESALLNAGEPIVDLQSAELRGILLDQTHLSGINLRNVDLREAHLNGAELPASDLREAKLDDADLTGVDLSESYLRGATLRGAIDATSVLLATSASRRRPSCCKAWSRIKRGATTPIAALFFTISVSASNSVETV